MNNLYIILIAFALYFVSGFVDFWFKERAIQKLGYRNIPKYFSHEEGWHYYIISIWVIPMVGFSIIYDWKFLLCMIPFYTEDFIYFSLAYIFYGRWFQESVPYLHDNIGWYMKIVGKDFPRKNLYRIYSLQLSIAFVLFLIF